MLVEEEANLWDKRATFPVPEGAEVFPEFIWEGVLVEEEVKFLAKRATFPVGEDSVLKPEERVAKAVLLPPNLSARLATVPLGIGSGVEVDEVVEILEDWRDAIREVITGEDLPVFMIAIFL